MTNSWTQPQYGNYVTNMWNYNYNPTGTFSNFNNFGNFGNFGMFGNFTNPWGFGMCNGTTTRKKTAEELAIECDAEIKKINEQIEQVEALKDQAIKQQAADGTVAEAPSLNDQKKMYDNAEELEDGTKVTYAKTEKMSFGQKLMRGLGKFSEGAWGCVKSLVGFEPDGSWNWKKCLKNVAITAACCFAAPLAGAALTAFGASAAVVSATTGAIAVGTRVASTGLKYYSMYKLGEGVYKGCTADTTKEFDEAWQQAGTNTFTLFGARAISKAISKTTTAYANQSAATTGTTTTPAPQASQTFGGKVWDMTAGKIVNGVKQDFSGWKATWQSGYASGAQMHNTIKSAKGFTGKLKAYRQVLTQDYRVTNQDQANQAKNNFDRQMQQNKDLLDREIAKLDQQIATASPAQRPVLEVARKANADLRSSLDNVTTHQDWANLQSQYRSTIDQLSPSGLAKLKFWGAPKVKGVEVDANLLSQVKDSQKLITESLGGLVNSKVTSIQAMSRVGNYNGYNAEVTNFGYNRWNCANRIDAWALKNPTIGNKFWNIVSFSLDKGLAAISGDLPYVIANPISNNPGALWWNWGEAITPFVKATPEEGTDMIWTKDMVSELNKGFEEIDNQIDALKRQKTAIYKKYEDMA